jgi:plasmid stabilization system protein ParE
VAELSWHLDARADLDGVREFIERDSSLSAKLFIARIVAAAEHLRDHAQMGRMVPEIGDESYRELIFQNYRIVYRVVRRGGVVVIGVIHAALDFERVMREREWDIT